jgi:spore germination protein KB
MTISPLQLMAILVLSRIEAASVFLPTVSVAPEPRDAWLTSAAGAAAAFVPLIVLGWLSLRNDGECLVGMARRFYGRAVGGAIGVYLGFFFLLCAACTTRHVVEAYTSVIMPETPGLVFSALIVLVSVYAAEGGAPVLGRTGAMVYAVAIPLLLLVTVLPLNTMRIEHLEPVLDTTVGDFVKGALISFAFSMQAIAGAMLFPYLKPSKMKDMTSMLLTYTVVSMVVVAASAAAAVAAYGPTAHTLTFPVLSVARRVNIAMFIERMEVIPLIVWTASSAVRIALFLWAAAACLDKSFGLARGRALMLPLGYVCVAVTSFIVKSVFEMLRFYQWDVWGVYGTLVQVGVIAVLAAGYLVHSVRKGTRRGRS